MRRLPLHLTCFIIAVALCAASGVDVREAGDGKAMLRRPRGERSQLGLPAPHEQPRAPLLHFFVAPGVTPTVVPADFARVMSAPSLEPAPELAWRARAHPSQAPPN